MVKKLITRLSVFVLLIAIVTACSKDKGTYTDMIPADATGVLSINLKSLGDKAGVNDKENQALKQKGMDALKSGMNAAAFQQMEKIMKDPLESGFDIKSPVYIFTSPALSYALIMKVDSEDKVRETLELAVKEQLCQPIEQAEGYSYTMIQSTMLAFNKTGAIALEAWNDKQLDKAKATIATLMKQTSETSITQNAGFRKMLERKGDFNFFASMAALPSAYARQINFGLSESIDLKELMGIGDLSFEKGKVAVRFEYYTENEAIKEQMKKQEKAVTKLSGTFLKNFPASTLGFFSLGVNGDQFYNILIENDEFRNNVSLAEADEIKNLFHSFKGDISIGLLNVGIKNEISLFGGAKNTPSFVAYAELKDGDVLKKIYENKQNLRLKKGEDIIKLSENNYLYKGRDMNIFFGQKDKQMYLTNDEMVYKTVFKTTDPSIKDMNYTSNMKGKNVFFAINMESVLELPIVKMLVGLGGQQAEMYYQVGSEIEYLEWSGESGNGQLILSLKNKDTNALKQMVDFARQFTGM